ncbi:MAG: bifunctional adenosylcobinamide kinase/adenosylcobinamide-phosphate guanylyltransferase [Angelakisella sp.]
MIFITGPLYGGKKAYIKSAMNLSDEEFAKIALWDIQNMSAGCADLAALADKLSEKAIVIATEVGGGVVPVNAEERAFREAAGRLACMLAQRADTVIRVCCGLPQLLKGELPC